MLVINPHLRLVKSQTRSVDISLQRKLRFQSTPRKPSWPPLHLQQQKKNEDEEAKKALQKLRERYQSNKRVRVYYSSMVSFAREWDKQMSQYIVSLQAGTASRIKYCPRLITDKGDYESICSQGTGGFIWW